MQAVSYDERYEQLIGAGVSLKLRKFCKIASIGWQYIFLLGSFFSMSLTNAADLPERMNETLMR